MNPVFWFLVILIAVVIWFLLAFVFYPLGRFLWRIGSDAMSELSKKQIYVVGDVPQEIMLKALFHELTHWVQDISGRHFDEDEANLLAERVYEALPHDMRGEQG